MSASPDISVELDGLTFADEDVAVDDLLGITVPTPLGTLPPGAAITAYGQASNGEHLLAFETTVELPGSVVASRGDVVRYDGGTYSIEFDASVEGIPDGVMTDAVADSTGLLLSFGTTVDLGGVVATDEDVVRWNGTSFSMVLDASAAGIDPALDLDAVDDAGGGLLWVSFDSHGSLGGQTFADEDVLLFDPSGPSLTLVYDGSAHDPSWGAADLDAVFLPEPGLAALVVGIGALVGLNTYRNRHSQS